MSFQGLADFSERTGSQKNLIFGKRLSGFAESLFKTFLFSGSAEGKRAGQKQRMSGAAGKETGSGQTGGVYIVAEYTIDVVSF